MHQYGINVEKINDFFGRPQPIQKQWGIYTAAISHPEYSLERYDMKAGAAVSLSVPADREATLYIEDGSVSVQEAVLGKLGTLSLKSKTVTTLQAERDSAVYVFMGIPRSADSYGAIGTTSDYREKYWGDIQTIVNRNYTGKRMLVKTATQASLEFHCAKQEAYYIHSGVLLLRLRAGRAQDFYFELEAGSTVIIPPGLMHQRGGLNDALIIEASTHDEDSDSFLVEDGQTTPMPELKQRISTHA